jgi:hypothetical protein
MILFWVTKLSIRSLISGVMFFLFSLAIGLAD